MPRDNLFSLLEHGVLSYTVHRKATIIYKIEVNEKVVSGKLINVKKGPQLDFVLFFKYLLSYEIYHL